MFVELSCNHSVLRNVDLKFEFKKDDLGKRCQAICIIASVNNWLASSIRG